jgi:hypothetical protein
MRFSGCTTGSGFFRGAVLWLAAAPLLLSCGLTVTNERPTYDEMDPVEKDAVQIILGELRALDEQTRARSLRLFGEEIGLDPVVDRERIHVSFEGVLFTFNLGDGVLHVAVWQNLNVAQQTIVAGWFDTPPDQTRQQYEMFFYRFMAVAQGVKQFMFNALGTAWVFENRSLFNIERDSIRTALSFFAAQGRKETIWNGVNHACAPVLAQYADKYGELFIPEEGDDRYRKAKQYLHENLASMADPENPTGYIYFICQWNQLGQQDEEGLDEELRWLYELPLP